MNRTSFSSKIIFQKNQSFKSNFCELERKGKEDMEQMGERK